MPLRDGCSDEDIAANIAYLIENENKPPDQAAAIAYARCGKSVPATKSIRCIPTGLPIKAIADDSFEGYLVRFSSPDDRDLEGEWFSPTTMFMRNAGYPIKGSPVNYQHGLDPEFGTFNLGIFDLIEEDKVGLFVRGQLYVREQYEEMLKELGRLKSAHWKGNDLARRADMAVKTVATLIKNVPMQFSMGADAAAYVVNPDTHHIDQCGIIHGALTPTPADNKNPLVQFKSAWMQVVTPEPGNVTYSIPTLSDVAIEPPTTLESVTTGYVDMGLNLTVTDNQVKGTDMSKLKALTPEEATAFRESLLAWLDTALNELGMKATEEEKDKMTDEMEENLTKQDDDSSEGIVEEAAAAVAGDVADVVAEGDTITEAVVTQIVEDNLEEILPEAVKTYMANEAQKDNQRKTSVSKALDNYRENVPANSVKNQRGGFADKNVGIMGLATKPTLGSTVKSLYTRRGEKALNPYIGPKGGDLVGQEMAQQILDPLRAEVVAFDMGVKQTNVTGVGIYTVPKMTTAPTAYRPGINTAITASDPVYDTITAYLRPLAAMAVFPRQMVLTAGVDFETQLKDQLVRSMRLQIDKEIFLGEGSVVDDTGAEIKGILSMLEENSTLATTNIKTLATNGRVPKYTDLIAAETQVATGNVTLDDDSSGWVMHPRSRGTFRSLTTTTGEPLLYPNYSEKPYQEMVGYKVGTTTQVPIDVTTGTSTDTSYVFLGNYRYVEYVMANDIEMIIDEVTLANQLQVRIIAYTYSDVIVHYPEAFYVMKGVRPE